MCHVTGMLSFSYMLKCATSYLSINLGNLTNEMSERNSLTSNMAEDARATPAIKPWKFDTDKGQAFVRS